MKKLSASILCLSVALSLSGCDSTDYQKAKDLYDSARYEEALVLFEKLDNYKDSAEKVLASKYHIAYNQYCSATNDYSRLRDGKKSDAKKILDQYEKALTSFEKLGDYDDSPKMRKKIKSEMLLLTSEKGVSEVVELYNSGDTSGATDSIKSYLEITELNGTQHPYALAFTKRAKELLDTNEALAYFIANSVVTWSENNNIPEYSASELYYTFPKLHWRTRQVGDIVKLGRCMQDDNSGNTQPIEWIVLAKKENKMLLLSKKGLRRGTNADTYRQKYLQTAFSSDELDLIGSYNNITDLSLSDYEQYGHIANTYPCIATYWAFTEKQTGVYQIHSRWQWQIDELDTTPVYWFIADDKIVSKAGDGFAYSPSEVYCRPSVWITIK